jgi:hypothetical protein
MRYFLLVVEVVIVGAVACGGDDNNSGHLPDAPPIPPMDGAVDTPAPQPITLTAMRNGAPVAGVLTYFLAADGSLGDTVKTNDQGVASSIKADGGSVTAIDPFPPVFNTQGAGFHDLRTFLGVKAGDHLVLTQNDDPPKVKITFTAKTVENAQSYEVFTTCELESGLVTPARDELAASDPTGEITLSGCNGVADILVIAQGSELGTRALYRANVSLTDGAEVNLTGENDTYQAVGSVDFNYKHVLGLRTAGVTTTYKLATTHGLFQGLRISGSRAITGEDLQVRLDGAPAIAGATGLIDTSLVVEGDFQPEGFTLESRYHVIDPRSAAAAYDLDMAGAANRLLPAFLSFPSYNPTTQRVSWVEALGGVSPDLTIAQISVFHADAQLTWTLAAPYTPGEVKFPTLPTDVADLNPVAGDRVNVEHLINAKVPDHYDGIRARVLDVGFEAEDRNPAALATTGTAVTVEAGRGFVEGGRRAVPATAAKSAGLRTVDRLRRPR